MICIGTVPSLLKGMAMPLSVIRYPSRSVIPAEAGIQGLYPCERRRKKKPWILD